MPTVARKKLPPAVLDYFREQGRKGGKLGGKMALTNMTVAERRARAKKAGEASGAARRARAAKNKG